MTEPTKVASAAGRYEATLEAVKFPRCRSCGASQEVIWVQMVEGAPPVPKSSSTKCNKCGTKLPAPTDRRSVKAINMLSPVTWVGSMLLNIGQWLRRKGESL